MNEVLKQLRERKSTRVFEDREITAEQKAAILEAATHAPTAGNQQLYTIIDVTDQEIKEKLVVTCDDQPFIARAKMVLIFCADCQKWYDAFALAGANPRKAGVGDLMLAVSDANIAAQNAVVAAHSLGIGSCYIGDVMENCEQHRELLNLPEYVMPAAMLVFGFPDKSQFARKKPERTDVKHIVCENKYKRKGADELHKMFAKRSKAQGFDNYMREFCDRKYNSSFSREMTESVKKYIQKFN